MPPPLSIDAYHRLGRQPRAPRFDGRRIAEWLTGALHDSGPHDWPPWLLLVLRPLLDECTPVQWTTRARRLATLLTGPIDRDPYAEHRARAAALRIAMHYSRRPRTHATLVAAKRLCERLAEGEDLPGPHAIAEAQRTTKDVYAAELDLAVLAGHHALGDFPASLLYTCLAVAEVADPTGSDRERRLVAWDSLTDAVLGALEGATNVSD